MEQTSIMSKEQVEDCLRVSKKSFVEMIKSENCPHYYRVGNGKTASYRFPMINVAEYMLGFEIGLLDITA